MSLLIVGPLRLLTEPAFSELPKLLSYQQDQLDDRIVESDASGFSHGFWISH